jgi:uncharacterized membrane protein YcaP (DUF421 family)
MWIPALSPVEVIFRAALVYFFVQLGFRVLGRKEWNKYSAYNLSILFLIAVALRMTLVGNDQSITSGLLSLVTMLTLDWVLSYLSFRNERLSNLIKGSPRVLIKNGQFNEKQMIQARISRQYLASELRVRGHWNLDQVQDAILEQSGTISFRMKNSEL